MNTLYILIICMLITFLLTLKDMRINWEPFQDWTTESQVFFIFISIVFPIGLFRLLWRNWSKIWHVLIKERKFKTTK